MRSYLKDFLLCWIIICFVTEVHAAQFLRTVALTGEQVPGMPGVTMGLIGDSLGQLPIINNAGQTAFLAYLVGTGVSYPYNRSVWLEDSGNFQMVVRDGDQMPNSSSDQKFSFLGNFCFDSSGHITFTDGFTSWSAHAGDLTPRTIIQSDNNSIWAKTGDTIQTLVAYGDAAPGTPDGVYFNSFGTIVSPSPDKVTFLGNLSGPGVTHENSSGLWTLQGSELRLVARSGNFLPTIDIHTQKFPDFGAYSFDMNSAGEVIFGNHGLWKEEENSLRQISRYFSGMPDPHGETDFMIQSAAINASGNVAFYGSSHRRESGIDFVQRGFWIEDGNEIRALGELPQDLHPLLNGHIYISTNAFSMNSLSQVAFIGSLGSEPWAIWASDRSERWREIVQIGDVLEVRPNDYRTVGWVEFESGSGNADGRPSGFNDRGQLVFRAMFTDGSMGVFVSDLATIPEPRTASLFAVVVLCGVLRRSYNPLAA